MITNFIFFAFQKERDIKDEGLRDRSRSVRPVRGAPPPGRGGHPPDPGQGFGARGYLGVHRDHWLRPARPARTHQHVQEPPVSEFED